MAAYLSLTVAARARPALIEVKCQRLRYLTLPRAATGQTTSTAPSRTP